jgi:hypothetical protein
MPMALAISRADIIEVQAWMGHAVVGTTMRDLHYRDCGRLAERLSEAFRVPGEGAAGNGEIGGDRLAASSPMD